MIGGRPVLAGAGQLTSRLVVLPEVAVTVGIAGATGFSTSLSTLIVTAIVSEPPLLSSAFTVTE